MSAFTDKYPDYAAAPPLRDDSSAFTKGLRSGFTGLRSQATSALGGIVEGLGAPNVARELYASGEGLALDAAEQAPPVRSYKEVLEAPDFSEGLRRGFDYTTGLLGQSLPTVVPAVAGALIAKRPIVGSTAALAVPEAGDVIQRQQADPATAALPVGERNLDALLGGGASAAVQSVVPAATAAKLAGRTAATAAKNTGKELAVRSAAAIPVEGAAEAGGEAVKQIAAGQPLDSQAIIEAGVGGAVAGGALGAAGGVGEGLHGAASRAGTTVRETLTDAGARAGEAVRAAGGAISSAAEKAQVEATGLFKRMGDDRTARAVKADDLVDAPEGLKPGDADAVAASDAKATDWAKTKLEGWINDAGLDQETRAKANDLLGRVADPAARVEVATMALARQASERASDFYTKAQKAFGGAKEAVADHPAAAKVRNMLASLNSGEGFSVPAFKKAMREAGVNEESVKAATDSIRAAYEKARTSGADISTTLKEATEAVRAVFDKTTKKSADYRGTHAIIAQEIKGSIEKTNPELLEDPESMERVAAGIRAYVEAAKDGHQPEREASVTAYLRMYLGADTIAVLKNVFTKLHKGTAKEREAFFDSLQKYDEELRSHNAMRDVVKGSLEKNADIDVDDAVEALRGYVRGAHLKKSASESERTINEKLAKDEITKAFGKKADKVIEAFQQEFEAAKTKTAPEGEVEGESKGAAPDADEATESEMHEAGLAETELEPEALRVYRGKGKAAVPNLAEHRRLYGDAPSQVERLMERARKENPDRRVSFITARDFERVYGEKMDVPDVSRDIENAQEQLAAWKQAAKEGHETLESDQVNDQVSKWERRVKELKEIAKDADTKYGAVVVEGDKQDGQISEADARKMLLDSKAYANSKSRINTDQPGITLDAYKIVQQTLRSLPYIEGESSMRRIARAFYEGLGSAMMAFDAKPEALNDALLLAVRNSSGKKDGGVRITLGDVKHYKGKGEYSLDAKIDLDSELTDLQRLLAREKNQDKREFLKAEIDNLTKQIAGRESERQGNVYVKEKQKIHPDDDLPAKGERKRFGESLTRKRIEMKYEDNPLDISAASLREEKGVAKKLDPSRNIHEAELQYGDQLGSEFAKAKKSGDTRVSARVDTDDRAGTVRTAMQKAKPAVESEIAEGGDIGGVLAGRAPEDQVKDIVSGKSVANATLAALSQEPPIIIKRAIKLINDTVPANRRERQNANAAVERLNDALAETLKKSPDVAYSLQLANEPGEVSAKARKHVEKYIDDVLPRIAVEWAKIAHAGEFTPQKARDLIRLSVHALDPMGTAYHESLHALFKHLRESGNNDVWKVLNRAAESAPVMNQLKALLKGQPEALAQLKDPEERAAYMYQFYAQEKLRLGPDSRNVLQKIKDFILKVMGIWTNDQRAEHIMDMFHEGALKDKLGDTNAVARALMEPGTNRVIERVKRAIEPLKRIEAAILSTGAERLRDTENPALVKLAHMIAPETGAEADDVGFIQAYKNESVQRMNKLARKLKGRSADDIEAAHAYLKRGEAIGGNDEQTAIIKEVRDYLDEMRDYMRDKTVRVKDLGYKNDYFPRVWDIDYISKHQAEFIAMLNKIIARGDWDGDPHAILKNLLSHDGTEMGVVVDMPGMQHTKERILKFITPEDAAPFVEKSLLRTLNSYTVQAARRAEWAYRFGDDGSGMRDLLKEAKEKHGATQEEIDTAQDFIRSIDGTLGDDISPAMRRIFGNMIVYQNIRLLPLAIFSQVVDPGGILVRGGTFGDAFKAFKRGITEIPRGFKKDKHKDEWYELAETIGAIDDATLAETLGSSYTQGMVSDGARAWNDALFKFNLVEQFTNSMRVGAVEAAVRFIARHGDGKYSEHSTRWMEELGLTSSDVVVKDGKLLVTHKDHIDAGYSEAEALARSNKMKAAVNKWVDGAILRPNAANKPIWMSDPHYALVAHLKQFIYAFQETILKRAFHEAAHGNYGPALALAGYVPVMIASDLLKGMIQGGGEQPQWKKDWGVGQYLHSGIERAGLYGVGQFSTDLLKGNIGSILGPTIEQLGDAVRVVGGNAQFDQQFMKALPANALYSGFLDDAGQAENTAKFTR